MIDDIHIVAKYLERGPGKVVSTLRDGLRAMGIKETSIENTRNVACLQWGDDWPDVDSFSEKHVLIGPNYESKKFENVANRLDNFIVPSEWVRNIHATDPIINKKNIHVWSGGIETEIWAPTDQNKDIDCIIYLKNRNREEYACLEKIVTTMSSVFSRAAVFHYGHYNESDFFECAKRAKFAILLTNTESQGYAYMQLLSAGVPCLVFNKDTFYHEESGEILNATSVPYFDDRCGIITSDITEDSIEKFLSFDNSRWSPRDYILENHTIEKSTMKYLELLKNSNPL